MVLPSSWVKFDVGYPTFYKTCFVLMNSIVISHHNNYCCLRSQLNSLSFKWFNSLINRIIQCTDIHEELDVTLSLYPKMDCLRKQRHVMKLIFLSMLMYGQKISLVQMRMGYVPIRTNCYTPIDKRTGLFIIFSWQKLWICM